MTRPRWSLARRLVAAQVLVVATMALTVVLVAAMVGPPVFDQHMEMAGHAGPEVLPHAEEAFRSAGLAALLAGLAVAAVGAILVAVATTRRLGRSLSALAAGAERVSEGAYGDHVELPAADRELQLVADSFNAMSARLADVEDARRRMLTDLAHEMRTPLAVIDVTLEGIEDGVVVPDAATVAALRQQSARLRRLTTDIRDVSAAEEGRLSLHLRRVPLGQVVQDASDAQRPWLAGRGVELRVGGVPDAVLNMDPQRVGQVLDNVLRNAGQHTPAGGLVTVGADVSDEGATVVVTDTGSGIAADDLPHVFERFYRGGARTHEEDTGTGVGLAIGRAIAVAHGGSLTAESDGPGTGTTVRLTLPRA